MTNAMFPLRAAGGLGMAVMLAVAGLSAAQDARAADGSRWPARAAQNERQMMDEQAAEAAMRQLSPAQRAELREQLRSEWNARHPGEGMGPDASSARADNSPPRRGWQLPSLPWREPRP